MMSRDAVLSDTAIFRPSDGDVSSSTGTVVYWIAVPLFGTYYNPEIEAVKRIHYTFSYEKISIPKGLPSYNKEICSYEKA